MSQAPIDLAARWLGGSVLAATDESFGLKESLLVTGPASFEPGHYDHRGEVVDGWETRRRRDLQPAEPCDWAIIRLGAPGIISEIDVDTSFFTGNFPASCRVQALGMQGYPSVVQLQDPAADWIEIVGKTALLGDTHNLIPVRDQHRFTHLRLSAYPDGGIARLRVYGTVIPDPRDWEDMTVEMSSAQYGGKIWHSSNDFYTNAGCLIRPDTPQNMGDGWETSRRRGPGHDSVTIRLAVQSELRQIEVDTTHFKYNSSAGFTLWSSTKPDSDWQPALPYTELQPDTRHRFALPGLTPVNFLRLDAFPDGGLARIRAFGVATESGHATAAEAWQRSLPASQARHLLSGT